jgi:hypothetical protein
MVLAGFAWKWRNTDKIMNTMKKNGFLYGKVDQTGNFLAQIFHSFIQIFLLD